MALFHLAVVFEKGHIVGRTFRPRHDGELVIQFDTSWPHVVGEACALDAGAKIVAEFILVGRGELSAEEGGDLIGFERVNGGVHDGVIQGLEIALAVEEAVGGIFNLHEVPVIVCADMMHNGTKAFNPAIETSMKLFGL
jgi:hypothetical protein